MKVALVSDLHFGVRNNSKIFLHSQMKFFREQFIPYVTEQGIEKIFILGDVFDSRNSIHSLVFNEVFKLFNEDLKSFDVRVILGNHDIYYSTTNDVNSLKFLSKFKNVKLYENIKKEEFAGKSVLFVPWQTDYEKFKKKVTNQNIHTDVCLGHFDILSFSLNDHSICDHGVPPELFFSNYTLTFTGHFHKRNEKVDGDKRIVYIGSPYQMDRSDYGDKGFCILDLENMDYEFVNNTVSLKYKKFEYPQKFTEEDVKGNIVDVVLDYSKEFKEEDVQDYFRKIEQFGPLEAPKAKIINQYDEKNVTASEEDFEGKDSISLMRDYINTLDINNKKEIEDTLLQLYEKCIKIL